MKPDPGPSPTALFRAARSQPLDPFAARLIRRKARQLIGRAGFTRSDLDDIEQELTLKLLKQRPAFDAGQAPWRTFVATVIGRHAANLLRDQQAKKRDWRRVTSLSVPIEGADNSPVELAETISRREQEARLGRAPRSDAERAQLASDVAEVLARLPAVLRDVAAQLQEDSASAVARSLGWPRTTLLRRLEPLRRAFEAAGLRDYL